MFADHAAILASNITAGEGNKTSSLHMIEHNDEPVVTNDHETSIAKVEDGLEHIKNDDESDNMYIPDVINGGVLGIYRVTLWIILLTLTVISMTITSLT